MFNNINSYFTGFGLECLKVGQKTIFTKKARLITLVDFHSVIIYFQQKEEQKSITKSNLPICEK